MSSSVRVNVESGILEGTVCENDIHSAKKYYSFQGIPYAKPPIGELRFKAPQPVEPWNGVKNATKDGEQCFSRHILHRSMKLGSEDCLHLNVYTPKLPEKKENLVSYDLKPVMVFIHGGAFTTGSNSKLVYGPEFLLREDVVLVVINYRLGFLGFFSLKDTSLGVPGNAGFKDQVMALKWIQKNIKNFNGDPNNVTIFGESAGASSVHLLMLSPSAKGLFHKAIAQSGSALSSWAHCGNVASHLANLLEIDRNDEKKLLQVLQNMPVEELHMLQDKTPDLWRIDVKRSFGFVLEDPKQDGEPFLTEDPLELLRRGEYTHIPFLIGFTSREGMLVHVFSKNPIHVLIPDIEMIVPFMLNLKEGSPLFKQVGQRIMKFYFGDRDLKDSDIDQQYLFLSDNFFIRDVYKAAIEQAKTSTQPLYMYEMTIETSINIFKVVANIKSPGVCHADDLGYLFKTPLHENVTPNSPEDIGIRRFCKLWANFAKYGNPNSPKQDPLLPVLWKPFTLEEESYIEIGKDIQSKAKPAHDRMQFWAEIFESRNIDHKL
ncbi:hypothetical protein HHI36_000696 [Cryptolaemus montrouzieri]|uniref:Carboxylesterase type B domain-containing protein n=1 Tax=Cryptolaemus montrouzieri TaxID=559131 RepID=A0ABD2P5Q3_9CUCU